MLVERTQFFTTCSTVWKPVPKSYLAVQKVGDRPKARTAVPPEVRCGGETREGAAGISIGAARRPRLVGWARQPRTRVGSVCISSRRP